MTRSIIGLRFWETFYQLLKWKKLKGCPKYKRIAPTTYGTSINSRCTEQPIVRPIDYELQKDYYSGKKKKDAYSKNQFIVLPQGQDIVDITVGKTSDINLFENTKINFMNHKSFMEIKASWEGRSSLHLPSQKKPKTVK